MVLKHTSLKKLKSLLTIILLHIILILFKRRAMAGPQSRVPDGIEDQGFESSH
jgi:hypothetical protein